MFLVELLLPLFDNDGRAIPNQNFDEIFSELTARFGGVTAFVRSPAEGAWKAPGGGLAFDRVVIFQVMTGSLDKGWWSDYRKTLEQRFRQEKLLVRATEMIEI